MSEDDVKPSGGEGTSPIETDEGAPPPDDGSNVPAVLGAQRYVLAGFFATGIGLTYVLSKAIASTWARLAESSWVLAHAPIVSRLAEDERAEWSTLVATVLGVVAIIYVYRREDVRAWTSEVASELAKVTWPSKQEVTNSTIVVILTSAFATVFLALLDRFWGFVTDYVYKFKG